MGMQPSLTHASRSKSSKEYTCSTSSSECQLVGKYTAMHLKHVVPQLTCNWQTLLENALKDIESIWWSKRLWIATPTPWCPLPPSPPLKNNLWPTGVTKTSSVSTRHVSVKREMSKQHLSISAMKSWNRSSDFILCKFFVTTCKCMNSNPSPPWFASSVECPISLLGLPNFLQPCLSLMPLPHSSSAMKASKASRTAGTPLFDHWTSMFGRQEVALYNWIPVLLTTYYCLRNLRRRLAACLTLWWPLWSKWN